MADGSPIEFAIKTPNVDLAANVHHALSLGLDEADRKQKSLALYANGPSARSASLEPDCDTMAINGALKLFTDQKLAPTFWICCDPQGPEDSRYTTPLDFLRQIPMETIYLVASKCHPAVFARLWERDVRLWHVNDVPIPGKRQVPCAVSVTICAMLLAQRLGYRKIDVYGWDCCFDGEAHHAATGELGETPQRITIEVGNAPDAVYYDSNPTWACELKDAAGVLPVLRWAGTDVVIHGKSLVAAVLPEYAATDC